MNWGHKITLSFVIFMAIIISMVVISMKQDVGLVSEDYYKQEIAYQDQIDRIKRTRALSEGPRVGVNRQKGLIEIELPGDGIETGDVWLFRPSDDSKDKKFKVPLSGTMQIPIEGFVSGRWQVKIQWTSKGLEYYTENNIDL